MGEEYNIEKSPIEELTKNIYKNKWSLQRRWKSIRKL